MLLPQVVAAEELLNVQVFVDEVSASSGIAVYHTAEFLLERLGRLAEIYGNNDDVAVGVILQNVNPIQASSFKAYPLAVERGPFFQPVIVYV